MSSSFNWLTASFSWIRRGRKAHFQPKAPRFRPVIENLEGRLNPAPVASLPQLLDMPHSLVVLSPDIASQVPVAEYAGARVLTLDPTRDAISQISDSLAGQLSFTSLRVIGHGQPGSLSLAGQTINLATLQARSVEVAGWASHLTPDADILLYGCSVASTAGGRAFVNTLATLTGADVAASTDATGAGGNLTLEYTAGVVTDHLQASPQTWNKSGLQLPSEGEYNYNTNPDGTSVTITGYTGPGGAVTIPGTLGGLPVTAIGNYAFYNKSSLTSVTIPSSVTSIEEWAFAGCSSLTSLTIPSSVTSIGGWAFYFCTGITSLTIPSSVTSIADLAFDSCTSLIRINALGNAPALGFAVFGNVPATLYYTSGTTGWTNPWGGLPTAEMTGGDYQFSINPGGTSVTINGYTGPGGVVTIPGTLGGLPVTAIGERAFGLQSNLTGINIPSSVTSIGKLAFAYCENMASVTISESVTSIEMDAFSECDNLAAIEVDEANNDFSSVDGVLFNKAQTTLILCPEGKAGVYTIPSSVISIGNSAFEFCSNLTGVTIPESVTSIGWSAFAFCSSLTTIQVNEANNDFSSVDGVLFNKAQTTLIQCPGGKAGSITLPPSVTSIGFGAFEACFSLTAIEADVANNDFSSIDGVLFNKAQTALIQCPGGKAGAYTIPSGVISIGANAFASCISLTSVTIPSSVTSIAAYAFEYCTSLIRINALGNAPALGVDVFFNVPATLYYTSGTTGWTNPWGGLPTVESSPLAAPFSLAAGSLVASLGDGKIGILSATGNYQEIYPFPGYEGPLNVNTVNSAAGQNADTIVVAVAGRSLPHVLTIDSSTGFVTSSFYAFDPGFLGGVTVAGGVTRIGGEITVSPEGVVTRIGGVITSVILCGAGSGSSPSVSVFNATTSAAMGAFYAYSNQYLGGVRVALSEAGADGTSFAIIGSTINSHVVWFDLNDYYNPILSFNTFPDILTPNGVYVASGDLDDDGLNEIVVGAGQGTTSPQVAVFDFVGRLKKSFNAFDLSFLGGVQVGVADFNKDGKLDILAASGVGVPGTLNVFNYDNLALLDTLFISDSTLGSDVASNFSRG